MLYYNALQAFEGGLISMTRLQQLSRSYKMRAEQLRSVADLETRKHTSQPLLRIATEYDLMAKCADDIDRSHCTLALN